MHIRPPTLHRPSPKLAASWSQCNIPLILAQHYLQYFRTLSGSAICDKYLSILTKKINQNCCFLAWSLSRALRSCWALINDYRNTFEFVSYRIFFTEHHYRPSPRMIGSVLKLRAIWSQRCGKEIGLLGSFWDPSRFLCSLIRQSNRPVWRPVSV